MTPVWRGILLKNLSTLGFTLQYMAIKLAGDVPLGQVVFFRSFFSLAPVFLLILFTVGLREGLATRRPGMHLARSLIGLSGMVASFWALRVLPVVDVTGYNFLQPIFAVMMAALILKEHVGPWRGAAVLAGLAGVLLMIEPMGGIAGVWHRGLSSGAPLAVFGAFITATVIIFIRQMSATERGETIVFYFMTVSTIVGGIAMIFDHVPMTGWMVFWLIVSGLFGGLGQIGLTFCYRDAEPSLLAPFDYVAMVWAMAVDFFVFRDTPQLMVLAGAGVVVAAGCLIAWREHRIGRELASRVEAI